MTTGEIIPDKWAEFFQSFTSEHSGALVTIGMEGRHSDKQLGEVAGRELPLRSIIPNISNKQTSVTITIGGRGGDLLTHEVSAVSAVRLGQVGADFDSVVYLEARNRQTTTVTLSIPTASVTKN